MVIQVPLQNLIIHCDAVTSFKVIDAIPSSAQYTVAPAPLSSIKSLSAASITTAPVPNFTTVYSYPNCGVSTDGK